MSARIQLSRSVDCGSASAGDSADTSAANEPSSADRLGCTGFAGSELRLRRHRAPPGMLPGNHVQRGNGQAGDAFDAHGQCQLRSCSWRKSVLHSSGAATFPSGRLSQPTALRCGWAAPDNGASGWRTLPTPIEVWWWIICTAGSPRNFG